jgi:hypothetical protein
MSEDPLKALLDRVVSDDERRQREADRKSAEHSRALETIRAKVEAAEPIVSAMSAAAHAAIDEIATALTKARCSCDTAPHLRTHAPRLDASRKYELHTLAILAITHPRREDGVPPETSVLLVHKAVPDEDASLDVKIWIEAQWGEPKRSSHFIDVSMTRQDHDAALRQAISRAIKLILDQHQLGRHQPPY